MFLIHIDCKSINLSFGTMDMELECYNIFFIYTNFVDRQMQLSKYF